MNSQYDLSVIVPARHEMFLTRTVENILANKRGRTEVIVGLDGEWSDPPLQDHPDLTILYYSESIGQRAMTNQCVRLSKAKYIMKIDAHCVVDEGFDLKMMSEMKDNYTMIPILYNLYGFDWVCPDGHKRYQSPSGPCKDCGKPTHKDIIFKPRLSRKSEFYRFDTDLHFQYHSARKKQVPSTDILVETQSAQGSCFMLTRQKYWELDISEEAHGSWGQQGTEVACKTWLSGGRLVTNRKTWYSHLFRTQGGDFGFPYPQSGRQQENARKYSRKLFMENTWKGMKYPLSWLIEKFKPLPGWHDPEGKEKLDYINKKGEEFARENIIVLDPVVKFFESKYEPTKGIVYYTDNKVNMYLGYKVRKQILKANLPIVSVSLKPMKFGKNINLPLRRGYIAYFTQIVSGLEASTSDIIFFCEHDWLYHPSHFDFTPPRDDTFYYNWNWWRVRSEDGLAVHYDTQLLPGICAYRNLLLEYYKKQLKLIKDNKEDVGYIMKTGFEPGTHNRVKELTGYKVDRWESEKPNIDIRHNTNLTASKWKPEDFRNQKNCQNWKETDNINGWGLVKNNFINLLKQI